jgi:hypothetical protein
LHLAGKASVLGEYLHGWKRGGSTVDAVPFRAIAGPTTDE